MAEQYTGKYYFPAHHYRVKYKREIKALAKHPNVGVWKFLEGWRSGYVGQTPSIYSKLDEYIRLEWGRMSPPMNILRLKEFERQFRIPFAELVEMVNRHSFFQLTKGEAEPHIRLVSTLRANAKEEHDRMKKPSILRRLSIEQEVVDKMDLWSMLQAKEYKPQFNTKGFIALEKTLHPKTAPSFKELLVRDYMEMQKEAGIPHNEEVVRKIWDQGGIKHMWHLYGMLAFYLEDETRIDDFKNVMEPDPDQEYMAFISAYDRLKSVKYDYYYSTVFLINICVPN